MLRGVPQLLYNMAKLGFTLFSLKIHRNGVEFTLASRFWAILNQRIVKITSKVHNWLPGSARKSSPDLLHQDYLDLFARDIAKVLVEFMCILPTFVSLKYSNTILPTFKYYRQ